MDNVQEIRKGSNILMNEKQINEIDEIMKRVNFEQEFRAGEEIRIAAATKKLKEERDASYNDDFFDFMNSPYVEKTMTSSS